MKELFLLILVVFFSGDFSDFSDPHLDIISIADTSLHNVNTFWQVGAKRFTGYIVEYDDTIVVSKLPVFKGKENGIAYGWYKNGKLKFERHYQNGQREGIHKGWYPNGVVSFEYYFEHDLYEGEQHSYHKNGRIWQLLNYTKGYEEGKQKSWNDEGRVVNNFTVKNGKLYGVVGRFDCMSVAH